MKTRCIYAIAGALICLVARQAVCAPALTGSLLFHRYSSYGASSTLWRYDFGSNTLTNISASWGLYDPINGSWNYNKSQITFMAQTRRNGAWDVFLYTVSSGKLVNLTNGRQPRNEDPRFSPSGDRICYKETPSQGSAQLRIMDLTGNITNNVTSSNVQHSMPCYTAAGTALVYMRGTSPTDTMWQVNIDGTNDHQLSSAVPAYYPFVTGSSYWLFSFVNSSGNDQTYQGNFSNGSVTSMPFNISTANYSDATSVPGTNYVIVSSTNPNLAGASGTYDLYDADTTTGQIWNLNQYNTGINGKYQELGASYL